MKLLIFTQHFPPETVATGRRACDLAECMAERGHSVTVITGLPNHPSSQNLPFCQGAARTETAAAGYRILRVPVFRSANTRMMHRLLTYGSFVLSAAWAGLRQESPDIILAISPLPTGLAAMLVDWRRRAPLIFDLQDIWPDSALAVGVMKPSRVLRLLRRLERFFYRRCALIVGITEGFRHYLLNLRVKPEHVAVVHNGVDCRRFSRRESNQEFRRAHKLEDGFVVGYVGNIGLAQGLETVLDAAEALRAQPVKFLLVGEGTDKRRLQSLAEERNLTNVLFLDGVPRDRVVPILAACDAFLLILRNDPLFEITIPSKLYEYMAAGKPVICSVGGEAASLVASSRCGVCVKPSNGTALAEAVRTLQADPAQCRAMGEMGRHCAQDRFSRDRLMADYTGLAEAVARANHEPASQMRFPAAKALPSRKL